MSVPRHEKNTLIKYNQLLKNLNGQTLNEYFNISFPNIKLNQMNNTSYNLVLSYKRQYDDLVKLNLSYDLIKLIKSYVEVGFICTINILYTEDSPFRAPVWSIINNNYLNLKENNFFQNALMLHNTQYKYDWSPAIYIEKDLLCFIERILYKLHKINVV
jgi:hypothetical protein